MAQCPFSQNPRISHDQDALEPLGYLVNEGLFSLEIGQSDSEHQLRGCLHSRFLKNT